MEVYTTQSIKDYLDPFWKSIQREVYQTVSSDLEVQIIIIFLITIICYTAEVVYIQ